LHVNLQPLEDSFPAAQPEPFWAESIADAPLPPGSGAAASNAVRLLRGMQFTFAQTLQEVEASEAAAIAARARAATLEAELEAIRSRVEDQEHAIKTLRAREHALEANLTSEREARQTLASEVEDLRASKSISGDQAAPTVDVHADVADLKGQLEQALKQAHDQQNVISQLKKDLKDNKQECKGWQKRYQNLFSTRSSSSQVPKAKFQYMPLEFLAEKYTEEERARWTVSMRMARDTSVEQLQSHVMDMCGLQLTTSPEIVARENGELVCLQGCELVPEKAGGKCEFFLRGLTERDLESWRRGMDACAQSAEASKGFSPSSDEAQNKRRRFSAPVWTQSAVPEAAASEPDTKTTCDAMNIALVEISGDGDDGADKDVASSASAPSAADAVSRVFEPTQPSPQKDLRENHEHAQVQAVPAALVCSGQGKPICTVQSKLNVPGIKVYKNSRSKRQLLSEPQQPDPQVAEEPMKELHQPDMQRASEATSDHLEPQLHSSRALERCFSRSPSWHAKSSTERKARSRLLQEGPLPAAAAPLAPAQTAAGPVGPLAVRASGLEAAADAGAPPQGAEMCRAVVRGKQARLALQAFDCEQCRAFYEATGNTGVCNHNGARAWRAGTSGSRHRFAYAPTSTPEGFWDLSFPHDVP